MKIEVNKIVGVDSWMVRLDAEQEARFHHLATAANTTIAEVMERMLTDGVGFSIELLKIERPDVISLLAELGLKSTADY